jgi:CRISPR-associated exonuclease Cas4
MADTLFILPILVILIALWIVFRMKHKRATLQMPPGKTVYLDTQEPGITLYAHQYRLKGRPDFLLKRRNLIIPVEAKTGKTPSQPHEGHIMQLMAYCVLVEATYGVKPPYGVIRYPERQFEVEFTAQRETELFHILAEMQTKKNHFEVHRSHTSAHKCAACGVRYECIERLDIPI